MVLLSALPRRRALHCRPLTCPILICLASSALDSSFSSCAAVWGPAGERTQMINIMRGLAEKLATGVQVGYICGPYNYIGMRCFQRSSCAAWRTSWQKPSEAAPVVVSTSEQNKWHVP